MLGGIVRVLGKLGMQLVMPRVMRIMFGRTFLADPAREADRQIWRDRGMDNHPRGVVRALQGVIDRKPIHGELGKISVPTLVMVGDEDVATIPAKAERIHAAIPGSRLVVIPGAGHTSSVEQPAFVNAALAEFLGSVPAPVGAAG
jgi:pimeloyl-ACP methyl ester carboxylesterase